MRSSHPNRTDRPLAALLLALLLACGGEADDPGPGGSRHVPAPEADSAAGDELALPEPGVVVVRQAGGGYTVLANHAPLGLVLGEMQRAAGFELVLTDEAWGKPEVTLRIESAPLADALSAALEGVPFELYYVADEPGSHALMVVVGEQSGTEQRPPRGPSDQARVETRPGASAPRNVAFLEHANAGASARPRRAIVPRLLLLGAPPLARCAQLLGQLGVDARVALLPAVVLAPHERRLHGRPRQRCALEQIAGVAGDRALHLRVVRASAGIAQREVTEQEARDAALLDDVARRSQHDGRYAVLLQVARDQTHGLVAHGSEGHQQRDVHTVFAAAA